MKRILIGIVVCILISPIVVIFASHRNAKRAMDKDHAGVKLLAKQCVNGTLNRQNAEHMINKAVGSQVTVVWETKFEAQSRAVVLFPHRRIAFTGFWYEVVGSFYFDSQGNCKDSKIRATIRDLI